MMVRRQFHGHPAPLPAACRGCGTAHGARRSLAVIVATAGAPSLSADRPTFDPGPIPRRPAGASANARSHRRPSHRHAVSSFPLGPAGATPPVGVRADVVQSFFLPVIGLSASPRQGETRRAEPTDAGDDRRHWRDHHRGQRPRRGQPRTQVKLAPDRRDLQPPGVVTGPRLISSTSSAKTIATTAGQTCRAGLWVANPKSAMNTASPAGAASHKLVGQNGLRWAGFPSASRARTYLR